MLNWAPGLTDIILNYNFLYKSCHVFPSETFQFPSAVPLPFLSFTSFILSRHHAKPPFSFLRCVNCCVLIFKLSTNTVAHRADGCQTPKR